MPSGGNRGSLAWNSGKVNCRIFWRWERRHIQIATAAAMRIRGIPIPRPTARPRPELELIDVVPVSAGVLVPTALVDVLVDGEVVEVREAVEVVEVVDDVEVIVDDEDKDEDEDDVVVAELVDELAKMVNCSESKVCDVASALAISR